MTFSNPWLFLLLIPFVLFYFLWKEKKFIGYSSLYFLCEPGGRNGIIPQLFKPVLFGSVFFLIVAIAHPQTKYYEEKTIVKGREIALAIDTSFSMTGAAIETIKEIVRDFIKRRPHDLISITIFGTDAALIVMPTMETQLLEKSLERVQASQVGYQTSIGEGLFTAIASIFEKDMEKKFTVKELRKGINKEYLDDYAISFVKEMEKKDAIKNKLVILFTDGIYNIGISPTRPLRLLKRMGIKAYVVAVTASDVTGVDPEVAAEHIEELKEAIESTGGKYYFAENFDEVARFYHEIDKIEKNKILVESVTKKRDLFLYPTVISLSLLLISIFIENIWIRIP
ncbi:MAG: vWA domain-containing protein [Candidatus Loosdrechtia sp.]|uniref:vWA domain-containing protein n=1 Tax=Candidatus Loosdrechtia sp. TaxID=3101272 RepID=UPI003A5D694C|nr:MAG: VWA domain-containing protein [Candidatus Jettenia sp. AMX2]